MAKIKEEYEIKVRTFKDKFKQLEENEFNFLENEYNKSKDRMEAEYKLKTTNLENKLKMNQDRLIKQVKIYF